MVSDLVMGLDLEMSSDLVHLSNPQVFARNLVSMVAAVLDLIDVLVFMALQAGDVKEIIVLGLVSEKCKISFVLDS